jgi:hypothetical protein
VNVLEHVIENNGICTPIQRGGREGLLANVKTTTQSDGDHGLTRLEADEPSPSRHQASDVAITAAERCGVVTGPHLVLIDQRAVF